MLNISLSFIEISGNGCLSSSAACHILIIYPSIPFTGNGSWIPPPYMGQGPILGDQNYKPDKNVWLFNITADPMELNDVSRLYPTVVKTMLDRLAKYNATAVPCVYPKPDPRCDPKLHGGYWGPWEV